MPYQLPAITPELLEEIVRRAVQVAEPERIILFGSAARGETGPDSDLDLLVVKPGVEHRGDLAAKIHCSFWGLLVPIDVIVVTPEDIAEYADCPYSVIEPALREGKVIYAAPQPSESC